MRTAETMPETSYGGMKARLLPFVLSDTFLLSCMVGRRFTPFLIEGAHSNSLWSFPIIIVWRMWTSPPPKFHQQDCKLLEASSWLNFSHSKEYCYSYLQFAEVMHYQVWTRKQKLGSRYHHSISIRYVQLYALSMDSHSNRRSDAVLSDRGCC